MRVTFELEVSDDFIVETIEQLSKVVFTYKDIDVEEFTAQPMEIVVE